MTIDRFPAMSHCTSPRCGGRTFPSYYVADGRCFDCKMIEAVRTWRRRETQSTDEPTLRAITLPMPAAPRPPRRGHWRRA